VFAFEFIVTFGLFFEYLPHAEDVTDPIESRFRDIDGNENVLASSTAVIDVLPRLYLVGDRLFVISQDADLKGVVLGCRRSIDLVENGVLVSERDEALVTDVELVERAVTPKEAVVLAESRLKPRRQLMWGYLFGSCLCTAQDTLLFL